MKVRYQVGAPEYGPAKVLLRQPIRRELRMPKSWDVLVVCCNGERADGLVEVVASEGARAEVALTLGHGTARLHWHRAFAGIVVDAREGGSVTFVEQARAEGIKLPIFAIASPDSASAARLLEIDGCEVCLARVDVGQELRRWLIGVLRTPTVRVASRAPGTPPPDGAMP